MKENELYSSKQAVGENEVSTLWFTFIFGCNIIIVLQVYTTNIILNVCQKVYSKNVLVHSKKHVGNISGYRIIFMPNMVKLCQ